ATACFADGGSSPMIAWSRSGANQPRYSLWNGAAWGNSAAMASVGAEARWVVLRNCPTRNETVCLTLETGSKAYVAFSNGTAFTSQTQLSANTFTDADPPLDAAYEQSSGDCLLAFWDHTKLKVGYCTYSGAALSSVQYLALPSIVDGHYLRLC